MSTTPYNPKTVRKILKAARGRFVQVPDGDIIAWLTRPKKGKRKTTTKKTSHVL